MGARTLMSFFIIAFVVATGCAKSDRDGNFIKQSEITDEPGREADQEPVSDDVIKRGLEIQARGWMEPTYTQQEKDEILALYNHLDPQKIVPTNLLQKTLLYFHRNRALIESKDYISIVDFSKHSRKERYFLINMFTGVVTTLHVSHGKGSDPSHSGYATMFSNRPNSEMSSLGFYVTGENYTGKHGDSMRLDGLSGTNSKARERSVVIHGAVYVYDSDVRQGRSQGCLAFSMTTKKFILRTLKPGSLIYAGRSRYD